MLSDTEPDGVIYCRSAVFHRTPAPVPAAASTPTGVTAPDTGSVHLLSAKAKAYKFKNCTALHKVYKHGLGKSNAKDHVKGKTKPVTNFKHDTTLYNKAIAYNKRLDADKDGIACEQH